MSEIIYKGYKIRHRQAIVTLGKPKGFYVYIKPKGSKRYQIFFGPYQYKALAKMAVDEYIKNKKDWAKGVVKDKQKWKRKWGKKKS